MAVPGLGKPDILVTIQRAGIELRQRGARFWGICPFHSEKTPSFSVDPEKQRWKCFGCGENGDAIDFVRKLKGLSFREAVSLLRIPDGLRGNREHKADPQRERKLALSRAFGKWVDSAIRELSDEVWLANAIDFCVRKPSDLETQRLTEVYLDRECAEFQLSVLTGDDFEAKIELFKNRKGVANCSIKMN